MKVTKYMRNNKILVSFGLILVILLHASGLVERTLGMKEKSDRDQSKVSSIFSVLKIPNFPPKTEDKDDREDKALDKEE
jgi:hypothetical protein